MGLELSKTPSIKDWYVKICDLVIADKLTEGILQKDIPACKSNFIEKCFFFSYSRSISCVTKWFPQKYRYVLCVEILCIAT